jgi:phenylacetaldehyde dehydrogenase
MSVEVEKPALSSAAAKFVEKEHKLLIDGGWVAAESGKTFPVEDPATQETIAHAPAGDKADIDRAVGAARRAFETGPMVTSFAGRTVEDCVATGRSSRVLCR